MSGVFGPVTQIQVPDFAGTARRADEYNWRRQQMDQQNALNQIYQQHGQGLASPDPNKRMNILALVAQQGAAGAQMALPQIQELRNQMDLDGPGTQGGAPVAQPAAGGGGDYLTRLTAMESGGDPNARNPRSSATGAGQFIDSTWIQFAQANPQRFAGMSREQILAARNDPNLSREAMDWYRRENLGALQAQGLPANDGTAALSHRFGPGDAARLLRSDPSAPVASVVSPQVMTANPDLAGRTAGQVVGGYAQRFGGDTTPAQSGGGAVQRTPGGLVVVPGMDMARVERAMRQPGNPAARAAVESYQRSLAAHLQTLGLERRGEAEPMEIVQGPNGAPVLVPRSQAAGRMPASREGAPMTPERFQQARELAEAGAARSNTTVNSGDRRTDVLVADAWKASEDTAVAAGRRAALLGRAEQAFERFNPGILAERRIWLGQLARELGVRNPSTAEGEVLQQVQRQLELATVPQGQGAITENERGLIRQAVPVLISTPEGARQAISLIRRLDDYEMQIARIYRENARANGGQPNAVSVREQIADFVSRNQPPDVQAVIDNLSGPGPGGVQAEPPARLPALPRGFRVVQ